MTDRSPHLGEGDVTRMLAAAARTDVSSLHGPSRAQQLAGQLRRAILRGDLVPGRVLRIARVAENHRVKPQALHVILQHFDHEQLLTVRGDIAIVNPLDHSNLRSVQNLWLSLEKTLLRKSLEDLSPTQLVEFENLIHARGDEPKRADFIDDVIANDTRIVKTLFSSAMPRVGMSLIDDMLGYTVRYHVFTQRYLRTLETGVSSALTGQQLDTLRLLRTGDHRLACSSQMKVYSTFRSLQLVAFDTPWARGEPDEQPDAEVIPFAPRPPSAAKAPARRVRSHRPRRSGRSGTAPSD